MKLVHGNHRPALRPLACGVMLALSTVAPPLLARDLNNEDVIIEQGHGIEAWMLSNGSNLTVNGAATNHIQVNDTSTVTLNGATVTYSPGQMSTYAMQLHDSATAKATNTAFVDGGVWVANNARAELTGSSITFSADAPGHDGTARPFWGMSINNNNNTLNKPSVLLDSTTITVADRDDKEHYSSGIGVHMGAGELVMRNQSRIDAENVGVIMHGYTTQNHALSLVLDNAHIRGGRNAAIEINASRGAENTFNVLVAKGSTLTGEDGNLLFVRAYRDEETSGNTLVNFHVDNSSLEGNVTFDDSAMSGRLDVALRNNARLKGQFNNVTSASVGTGSRWTLTGSSTVGHLQLGNSGTVVLGDGSDGGTFNTLSVDSFHGDGGTLVFNTVLGDDGSATDTFVIEGNATGQAGVQVLNAGGQGGQTDEGIELITVGGESNARFDLIGRAVGGQYEYFLVQGEDGDWYLRSELQEPDPEPPHECVQNPDLPQCEVTLPVEPGNPTDPENPDPEQPDPENPTDPGKPEPVLRPETGAYLANQWAMDQLLQHSARNRMAAHGETDGVRTWASTGSTQSRQHAVGHQRLESTLTRVQIGADLGVFDNGNGRVGAMLGAGRADITSRSTVTGYRADGSVKGGSLGVYGHWSNDTLYVDASVQHGRFSNEVQGEGLATERYDARLWQGTVEAGYAFALGRVGSMALSLQPQLQLTYTDAEMDAHVESNGTVVRSTGSDGLSTRVGLRLQGEAVTGGLHLAPYLAVNAYADSRKAGMAFDGEAVIGGAPRHRTELSAGGQLRLGSGLSAWGEVAASQREDQYRELGARIGVSWRW